MTAVQRTAGVDGTFTATFDQAPVETPTVTIYSDTDRTVVAVATADLTATANPVVWTAAYPSTLAAGTYYLDFAAVYTTGQPAKHDVNDTLVLTDPDASVSDPLLPAFEARLGRTLTDPDLTRALACLEDAGALAAGVATIPTPMPLRVSSVILAAARRGFDNPSGLQSETIASYSYSRASDATGGVYLTDAERRIIRQACRDYTDTTVDTSRRLRARLGTVDLNDRYGTDYEYWQFNEFGQRY